MTKLPLGGGGDEPEPRTGWIAQLIALIRAAVFDPTWGPTAKIAVLAVVGVALFITVRVSVP